MYKIPLLQMLIEVDLIVQLRLLIAFSHTHTTDFAQILFRLHLFKTDVVFCLNLHFWPLNFEWQGQSEPFLDL